MSKVSDWIRIELAMADAIEQAHGKPVNVRDTTYQVIAQKHRAAITNMATCETRIVPVKPPHTR